MAYKFSNSSYDHYNNYSCYNCKRFLAFNSFAEENKPIAWCTPAIGNISPCDPNAIAVRKQCFLPK